MAGLVGGGGEWGPSQEALHPRDKSGRWRRKVGIPAALKRALSKIQSAFKEHIFHSNGQAGQWSWNHSKHFNDADRRRMLFDWDHANEALFQGETDPETEKFVRMMDEHMIDLPEDVIAHKVVPAEAFGFTPQQMGDGRGPGIADLLGGVLADPGYAMTGLGEPLNPNGGPGSVRMAIAVPKGTKVAFTGMDRNDRNMVLDRNQNLTITRIEQDGKGGFYMWAVATPPEGSEPGTGEMLDTRRRGAGLTPEERAAALATPPPAGVSTPERRAGEAPPIGAGGQVTQAPAGTPDVANQPQVTAPTPGGPPPRDGEPIAAESIGGAGPQGGAPSTSDIAQRMDQPAAPTPAPAAEPVVPEREVPVTPHQEALANVQKRAATKKAHREMRQAVPVAQAMQEMAQLDKQGASNEVKAQHIRGMISDPAMEEMAAPDREKLAQELESVAQDFDRGKNNQARAKLAAIGNRAGLTERNRAGETVDFDPATMEPVGDTTPTGQVEVIQPPIVHVDDNGRETVVSKGRVRSAGGAQAPAVEPAPEAPAAPVKAAKKAAGSKFTPEQEDRLVERAAQWRGQERNDEERRIVSEADKILARRGQQAAPTPVREPRVGRAPMAKKAAAPAAPAPAPAKKAAAPAKKAEPKKLTPERKPYSHTGANIIKEANEKLADGRDPEQVAEEMREEVEALLEHGEPLGTDDLVNPGRTEWDEDALRDVARADSSLIHRLADDLEKQGAPAPAKKAAAKAPAHPERAQRAERRAAEAAKTPAKKAPAKKAAPNSFERELEAGVQRDNDTVNAWLKDSGVDAADLTDIERTGLLVMAGNLEKKRLSKVEAGRLLRARGKKFDPIADLIDGTKAKRDKEAARKAGIEERAAARAAKKAATPAAKKAEAKDLTPEQRAAAEVQDRADEAGLPTSVTELRAAAKEQGIRGFSTMRKEQLQRALLGEEVSTGTTKLQVVSPEKMVGHLERVDTDSAARTLLDKHTLKDLKALADQLEIDHKERKLTTKDKLKTAILHEVRGAPGTDFEPVSPDEAVSIRDVKVPDGTDGDMLRRGLVEVDDTSPESLRDESERLESHATQLRQKGDRVNAALYQDAADRMGMRAQQISGMEEVPKPAKRVPRKAAVPKAKETATGTGAKIRAAADEATAREALKGKTALELKAIADDVKAPYGSSWTKARIEDSILEHGVRRRLAGDRRPLPGESAAAPKVTGGSIRDQAKGLGLDSDSDSRFFDYFQDKLDGKSTILKGNDVERPLTRREVADDIDDFIDNPFTGLKIQASGAIDKGDLDKAAEIRERAEKWRQLADRLRGRAPKKAAPPAPKRPAAEVARATERATKAVAPGSVPGPRAQVKVTNQERADAFREAWDQAGIPDEPGRSASRTMAEIRDRVHSGELSPEEGIRRLEVDIDFNKTDVAEIEAVLRDEQLDPAERKDLTSKLAKLHTDIAAQEKASKFMRRYFRKEPEVTAEAAKAALEPEQRAWLDGADPDELRQAAREQGLGELKGDTIQEVFQDAVQKSLAKVREDRAAKRAAKKALPKVEPKVDPENPERLDVRRIGTGIDFKAEDKKLLDGIQERLDAGESPAKIGESIDGSGAVSPRAQRKMLSDVTDLDGRIQDAKDQKLPASRIKALEAERTRVREGFARLEAQAKRQEELGRRLRAMPTPAKKGRRRVAPWDPYPIYGESGEEGLRERLAGLNVEQLRDMIAEHGMDPARAASRWDRNRLEETIVSRVRDRSNKGRAFRAPPVPEFRTAAKKAAPNPNLDGLTDAEVKKISESDKFTPEQRKAMLAELDARGTAPSIAPTRLRPKEIKVGDTIEGGEYLSGRDNNPSRPSAVVARIERRPGAGNQPFLFYDADGKLIRGTSPNSYVWRRAEGASAPEAPAPTKARRVGPGGSSFPADMPAEERARRVAEIEKRNPEVQAAKRETAEVQARLLTTAMERLENARTEAQVRDAVKGLTMPELKTVAGKYPLDNVGKSKESLIKALVQFHTNRANFEVLTRGGYREDTSTPRAETAVAPPPGSVYRSSAAQIPRVRPALAGARTPREVSRTFRDQARSITGRDVDADFDGQPLQNAQQAAEVLLRELDAFPDSPLAGIYTYGPGGTGPRRGYERSFPDAFAVSEQFQIQFNNHNADRAEERKRFAKVTGFSTTGNVGGTAAHEHGHVMFEFVSPHMRMTPYQIVQEFRRRERERGLNPDSNLDAYLARWISMYAAKDEHEMTAEAWADVRVNGDSASPLSKLIYEELVAAYRRRIRAERGR